MYPPPTWMLTKKQMLPENLMENNKFELVFDEVEDGPALRSILQPEKGATGKIYIPRLLIFIVFRRFDS